MPNIIQHALSAVNNTPAGLMLTCRCEIGRRNPEKAIQKKLDTEIM
jgi:hypothetical protein